MSKAFKVPDASAIDALVTDFGRLFSANDMKGWSDLFTDRADFISWGGVWWRTRAEIFAGHLQIPSAVSVQLSAYRLSPLDRELLSENTALAHARWDWKAFAEEGAEPEDRAGVLTLVLVKVDGSWKVRAAQNTRLSL